MKTLKEIPLPIILLVAAIAVVFGIILVGSSGMFDPEPTPTPTPTFTPSPTFTPTPTVTPSPTSTPTPTPTPTSTPTPTPLPLVLSSSAFEPGGQIPERFGFFRQDASPPLQLENVPPGTGSLALTVDDLDEPFTHWVMYNIPPTATVLAESTIAQPLLPDGTMQGINSNDVLGYIGPFPPEGETHRLGFVLYALDAPLELRPGATREQLIEAMGGHVLATSELIGTYVGVLP